MNGDPARGQLSDLARHLDELFQQQLVARHTLHGLDEHVADARRTEQACVRVAALELREPFFEALDLGSSNVAKLFFFFC